MSVLGWGGDGAWVLEVRELVDARDFLGCEMFGLGLGITVGLRARVRDGSNWQVSD